MKVHRLLEITTLLLNHRTITAREFAGRFNVSIRTIYRDIEDLSAAGIPVYMSKGKGGGISLLETFTLDKTLVSEQESSSLLMALKTLQATQYPEVDTFLAKLEALFRPAASSNWVLIEFMPWGSKPNEENRFVEIRQAILARKVITFDYIDARAEKSHRQVEPVQVIYKSQAWYLRGYCRTRCAFRTFRLSRIKNLLVKAETFPYRPIPADEPGDQPGQKKPLTTVKMRFAPAVTQRVFDDFDDSRIAGLPDGSCLVTVDLVEDEWVYGLILSYGSFVEVLEPAHLREIIRLRLAQALMAYNGENHQTPSL